MTCAAVKKLNIVTSAPAPLSVTLKHFLLFSLFALSSHFSLSGVAYGKVYNQK